MLCNTCKGNSLNCVCTIKCFYCNKPLTKFKNLTWKDFDINIPCNYNNNLKRPDVKYYYCKKCSNGKQRVYAIASNGNCYGYSYNFDVWIFIKKIEVKK